MLDSLLIKKAVKNSGALTGDKNQIFPQDKAPAMAATNATAKMTMVKDTGHMPMLEQPEATTTGIRNCLSAVGE